MTEKLPKYCDNKSVGVIIRNDEGEVALLKRARFPVGIAPPAGHVDGHGSFEQAAVDEVSEEVGLAVTIEGLRRTIIDERTVDNKCRRVGGDHHEWVVYETNEYEGEISPDPDETKGAAWYDMAAIQALANRTKAFQAGEVEQSEWEKSPGLEEVWLDFFTELGYVK